MYKPWYGIVLTTVLLCSAVWAVPPAAGQSCPEATGTNGTTDNATVNYNGPCGPTFTLPLWSDANTWDQPQYYTTIHLGDVDGDGRADLLGRSKSGVRVEKFQGTRGQWSPLIEAIDYTSQTSQLARLSDANAWNQPQYYGTIQTADIDGEGQERVACARVYGSKFF